jgi:hypothetical protein
MYIEFSLPQGISTRVMANAIRAAVAVWADRYEIPTSSYTQKTVKYTHRLAFNNEQHYSLFSMTWQDFDYRIINVGVQKY